MTNKKPEKTSKETWPRGSEWRKWDLHTHAPGTKLNDGFKLEGGADVWAQYCHTLEQSSVAVFGITDYFSVDCFFSVLEQFGQRYKDSAKVFFPNVELRTNDVVNREQEEVNVHIIFNPFKEGYKARIAQFLRSLKTTKTVADGRHVKASELSSPHDFEEATTTREFIREALGDVFGRNANIAEHLLIITAANNDGLRPPRGKKRKEVISDELDKFSHGLFGSARNVDYYLKADRYEDKKIPSHPKPTLSGSDAHSFAELDTKLGKYVVVDNKVEFEPTWIKADLTFEGLKQIIYEPRARVHIGSTPPVHHDKSRVIQAVRLSQSNGWFDDVEIPLNQGLVSIIGQKGSGKSALSELMAYAAGSWQADESGSFLRRADGHIEDLTVELVWADGEVTSQRIGAPQTNDQNVRYLSQKFVERLCADDQIGAELLKEIEAVIFAHTDPTDTLNASDFEELRSIKTEGLRSERDRLREDMARLIREECALRDNRSKLGDKKAKIKTLTEEEAGLKKQMPKPASEEEKKIREELGKKREALTTIQREVAAHKQQLQKISDIRTNVTSFKAQAARFYSAISLLLKDAGVPQTEWTIYQPSFVEDTELPLAKRTQELQAAIKTKEGTEEKPVAGTIRALQQELGELEKKETLDKAQQRRVATMQARLTAIGTELKRLNEEIEQINGPDKVRLDKARDDRLNGYLAYFDNLKLEQKALEELYEPVKKKLKWSGRASKDSELEFSIRWEANIEQWIERGGALFDQRKSNPYGTMKQLSDTAAKVLLPAWMSGDGRTIRSAFDAFTSRFHEMSYKEYVRSGVTPEDILRWLYEVDHVQLNYGLRYNKVELEKLSPGTKGIVLLILYLGLDTADTRPLIVDQPDENLDNESIYDMLRMYFQDAKVRRQIILISHNPNLVVNADSEQVIIATNERRENGLPRITYHMGSLEHCAPEETGIRQRACRILEGGDIAFQRRENRYSLARLVIDDFGAA